MSLGGAFERWVAIVRLAVVPFAILQVSLSYGHPETARPEAWALTATFAAGSVVFFAARGGSERELYAVLATAFDFAVIAGYALLYADELGTPTRELLLLAVVEGAIRFGLPGGVLVAAGCVPVASWFEERRSQIFHTGYRIDYVTVQAGAGLIMALIVGWLVSRLDAERGDAERQAHDAEGLRDELGRRADLLDAANRCARALSVSLDLDEAFGAFMREVRGLVPYHRMAIELVENGEVYVIAAAGVASGEMSPPGGRHQATGRLLPEVVARGQTIVRRDLRDARYPEEPELLALGIRSGVLAPLLVGARAIGVISLARTEPDAFAEQEIELVSLLGRLVGAAVQNIRAYEDERQTVEELRRLSELRADFVSLVSHELRSPMAAVIGAARTLEQRWDDLRPEQRTTFLGLIANETARLASLVGDVLDTSRIDAGSFTYRFADVDLAALVRDSVSSSKLGQDEVPVVADVPVRLPAVRADPERLRQVVANLIENAVKYAPAGTGVEVRATVENDAVAICVSDHGPGIAPTDQRLIFEKFGRVGGGPQKPGSGLGLYIARSIAEAHGGSLEVDSRSGRGATFTLLLPVG